MYIQILYDFFLGLISSVRIDLIFTTIKSDSKLQSLWLKILKYNSLLHILPHIVTILLSSYVNLYFVQYLISPISAIFHLIHYMDLLRISTDHCVDFRSKNKKELIDLISLGITMSIYSMVIYLTTELINIFFRNFYFIGYLLNFIILSIYHSFYCFNSLWQYHQISPSTRIDMHEKLWPYYVGYGFIATIIYLNTSCLMCGIYNIYFGFLMMIPFLIKPIFPKKNSYPSINLTIFSYLTSISISISIWIIKNVF